MGDRRPRAQLNSNPIKAAGLFVWRSLITMLATIGLVALAGVAWTLVTGEVPCQRPAQIRLARAIEALGLSNPLTARLSRQRVIYLNREGGILTAGSDDSGRNVSSVVGAASLERFEVPAFRGTSQRWDEVVTCVRDQFDAYNVRVVDQRPVEEPYVMVMVGGVPGELARSTGNSVGPDSRVRGIAPMGREPIEEAVVYVFSRAIRERVRDVCETAAQEIGHAYGLDHVLDCHDPMTHLGSCGPRTFRDREVPCGENEPRTCVSGRATQNSHRALLRVLGPSPPADPAPNPDRPRLSAPRAVASGGSS